MTPPDPDVDAPGPAPHLSMLFEEHPDPLFALDREGRVVAGNRAFRERLGFGPHDFGESAYHPFVHPDDAARVGEEFGHVLQGETRTYEMRALDRTGAEFLIEVTNIPVVVDGVIELAYGVARDLRERAATQAALEQSELRFRGLFEGSGAGIAIAALDGTFLDANPTYLHMLGYSLEELRGLDFLSITHPDDRPDNERRVASLLAGEAASFMIEKRYRGRDDRTVWVRASVSLIRDAAGDPSYIAATTEDITAAKLAEGRLRRSDSLRRLAGDLARVGGWSLEAATSRVYWSEEIFDIFEWTGADEPPLGAIMERYAPADRSRIQAAVDACLTDGTPVDLEFEMETFAGRHIPVQMLAEAERDDHGTIVRVIGAFQDISALRAATDAAEAAARRLTTTMESMTDAIYTLDRDWRFTFLNGRAVQLLRRDRDALLGRSIWDAFPETVDSPLHATFHRAIASGRTEIIEEFHHPALDIWFSATAYPSEQGLAVYFRDVTAAHEAREEIQRREHTLRRQAALLDEAQDAIVVRDLDDRINYWNRSAERLYGWSADEVMGADVRDLLYADVDGFDAAKASLLEAGAWVGELEHRDRHGERLTVDSRWTLVRDDAGGPDAVFVINTDVTAQKRVEQQLLRAQRMESLGTLASGVAHDLNNVLSPILLATELLQTDTQDPQEGGLLDTIAASARRGANLVAQVLSFARGVEGERTRVDVAELLRDIQAIVRDTFPKDIRFTLETSDELGTTTGDSTQIQQVLLNLAVNARDAMPEGGSLAINASNVHLDEQYADATPGTAPGDYLLVEVQDDGSGMTPDVRERVFEPFFTTKPHGVGTGLGLSTAAAIIRSHGGFINVYSEPGVGSRFRLHLPRTESAPAVAAPTGEHDVRHGGGATVLVVDDEPAVRSTTRQTLQAHGYRVLEAGDGAEAVSVFVQQQEDIDVVLTDMMMPVMDGPATIHALRRLDPELRIIGASGLHERGKVTTAGDAGVRHFLPKPYTGRDLLATLADVLGDPT